MADTKANTKQAPRKAPEAADSAEKAYAAASSEAKSGGAKPLVESLKADAAAKTAPADTTVAKDAPAKKAEAKKAAPKKAAPKKAAPKKAASKKAAPKRKAAPRKAAAKSVAAPKKTAPKRAKAPIAAHVEADTTQPTVTQLKEKIMATVNTDYTAVMTDAVKEMQDRSQAAYEKGTEAMSEMTDFAKGNVEAAVESGKILAEGVQAMGKTYADEAKSAYETATADMKEMAAIKSPTELFQLQGKIMRRNFDAMVAVASKNTDAAMKLANDVAAPLSGRVNVAAEKFSKVA